LILVADDDADILNLICLRLEQVGYEVVRATDGAEAVVLATERRPALCVLDVQMPGMNGYEAIERLRAVDGVGGVPIILLTASVQERDMVRGFEAGADEVMRKPFNPRELQERIEKLLRR
jgi:DNA-binding response OmpR family regulator